MDPAIKRLPWYTGSLRDRVIVATVTDAQENRVLRDPWDHEIARMVEECTGYYLTKRERRLAIAIYDLLEV